MYGQVSWDYLFAMCLVGYGSSGLLACNSMKGGYISDDIGEY